MTYTKQLQTSTPTVDAEALNQPTTLRLLVVPLQVAMTDNDSEPPFRCFSPAAPGWVASGINPLGAIQSWISLFAVDATAQVHEVGDFSDATDFLAIDRDDPARWCCGRSVLEAVGKWFLLQAPSLGIALDAPPASLKANANQVF